MNMKSLPIAAVIVAMLVPAVRANNDRLKDAALVLTEMAGAGDAGIPTSLIAKASCIVIVPSMKKVALGIGGEYGKGYLSCRRDGGWSAPGALKIEGGSFGVQIGASATDVIMLVMNDRGRRAAALE